ncbi:MAG: transcription termination/antitermination protein NusA [Acholeplasmatales bacterium]|nr:transcription termination/antitermination protein NusA [Acholeplasmatales bacterium]
MINKEFFKNAELLATERGITVQDVYDNFEKGLISSYKKIFGNTSCKVIINPDKNEILLYGIHKVVEALSEEPNPEEPAEILLEDAKKIKASAKIGDILEEQINIKNFTRTQVSAAKSVYTQGIIVKQREKAFEHFKALENEMVLAEVSNINEKFITLNLGMNVITTISVNELLPSDNVVIGSQLRVYIKKVEENPKNPKVLVSRTDRQLVIRLMENFIPEIKDGTIEIKGIARDPGDRCKIALYSNNPNVDAIGSCVGEAGSRIRGIVDALGGEKIDLYKWSDNPEELIPNSLQPASVTKVLEIDVKNKTSRVVVPDDQLSLAIGKSGQNVRLAVQSCGWKIDIIPSTDAFKDMLSN